MSTVELSSGGDLSESYNSSHCVANSARWYDDARAGDCAVYNDDFSQSDTDAKIWTNCVVKLRVALRADLLERERRRHCIRRPCKIRHECIATDLVDDTPVGFDSLREATEGVDDALVGDRLVKMNERGRTNHVGVQDDGELARKVAFVGLHYETRGKQANGTPNSSPSETRGRVR